MTKEYQVGAYYFPNYHLDQSNEEWHGKGWSEWEVLKNARSRFQGHNQPKIPLWGYEDESDPEVMEKKIKAAAGHGIDAFIFDWYWHEEGPFLHRCLEEGFLNAKNRDQIKFALMWANHDWLEIHPAQRLKPYLVRRKGMVCKETFRNATDHMICTYFNQDNYWRIDGKLYFSIYEMMSLIKGLGGLEETKRELAFFRERVKQSGLGEVHLNAVVWGIETLPTENSMQDAQTVTEYLGIDSVTSYVWVHHIPFEGFPCDSYKRVREICKKEHMRLSSEYSVPYYPNVTMGWDSSPRTIQSDCYEDIGYPFTPIYMENTPQEFEQALLEVKEFLDTEEKANKICTINAWNEWTEGSYLEPDTINGFAYLEAVKRVFVELEQRETKQDNI